VQEYRDDYLTIFWVAAGQKESIERDYLQIYGLLFNLRPVTGPDAARIKDAVAAVKGVASWSDGAVVGGFRQCGRH